MTSLFHQNSSSIPFIPLDDARIIEAMTTRELITQAWQYNHALAAYESLPKRKRERVTAPPINKNIQAGLVLMGHGDKQRALQYAMNMQQLAQENPGPKASFWNDVVDILAEATEV